MSSIEKCGFCNPPEELKQRFIYEDELIRSFLSNPRLTKGHALVVPVRHIEPPAPLKPEETLSIMKEMEILREIMLENFGQGVDIFQKSRPDVPEGHHGTKMDHMHWHVLPSNPDSELYGTGLIWMPDHFSPLTTDEIAEIMPVLARTQ